MKARLEDEIGWVVVMTQPNCEEGAERGLREGGYHVYLPRYRRVIYPHGVGRSGKVVMRPAFTGYLFAQDWRGWPDKPIHGIVGLMTKPGGQPVMLAAGDVWQVMQRQFQGVWDDAPKAKPRRRDDLAIGETVECETVFGRMMGTLDQLSDNGRAIVEVMLLGHATRMDVAAAKLIAQCVVDRDRGQQVGVG